MMSLGGKQKFCLLATSPQCKQKKISISLVCSFLLLLWMKYYEAVKGVLGDSNILSSSSYIDIYVYERDDMNKNDDDITIITLKIKY
jgi:hypothetical protein